MKIKTIPLILKTEKKFDFIDITATIKKLVKKMKVKNGILNIFSRHTTLAIKINENEHHLMKDMEKLLEEIAPKNKKYFHNENANGHLKTLILETSQNIPVFDFKLLLGQYQRIFAIETDGPKKRNLVIQLIGE